MNKNGTKKQFLTVIARIEAKPGCERKVRRALLDLISPTRVEKGCVDYELHVKRSHKHVFLFYENWISKSHLDRHLKQKHLKDFERCTKGLLARPVSISLWQKIR